MIAALLVIAIAQGESVAVTYDQVPPDVDRAVAYRWTDRAQPIDLQGHGHLRAVRGSAVVAESGGSFGARLRCAPSRPFQVREVQTKAL